MATDILDQLQAITLKTVEKIRKQQVEEAAGQGVPLEEILQIANIPSSSSDQTPQSQPTKPQPDQTQTQVGQGAGVTQQPVQQPQQQDVQGLLQKLGSFLSSPRSVSETGQVTPAKLLGGLITESPQNLKTSLEAQILGQEIVGKKTSAFDLEKFKQDRLDQRERLKASLKDSGVDEVTAGLNILADDVVNLSEAREALGLKGRLTAPLAAAGGFVGIQRDRRAVANSLAETLLFSFGEHIIKQKGRAFIGDEQKRVKKNVIGAFLAEDDKTFKARMNTILKQANNRLPEGATKFPDLETLLAQKKGTQQAKPGVSNKIQQEIDAIDAQIERLGGK